MAVTPFHTPIKTEYKPLGFDNLAQPLSDMQAKYDATKLALEDATYNIARLSQDDVRGKELIAELKDKTNFIGEELARTGNYRQAAIQLKKLNKSFTEDLETKNIVGNYEAYKKAAEEQQKRLEKKDITQTDYDTWDYRVRNSFKGTNYDPVTQKYTSINTRPPEQNREAEMQDLALKVTGMLANQKYDEIQNLGATYGFDVNELKRSVEYKDLEPTKEEVANFLKTQGRFKEFIIDRAERDYYYSNHRTETLAANGQLDNPDAFKDQVYQGSLQKIQAQINYAKKANKQGVPGADETLKKLETNLIELQKDYQKAIAEGTYNKFAEELYKKDALGQFDRLSYAAADLVDYRSSSLSINRVADEAGKKASNEAIKQAEEIGTIATSVSGAMASNLSPEATTGVLGTADPLNKVKGNLLTSFNSVAGGIANAFDPKNLMTNFKGTQEVILKSTEGLVNLQTNYNNAVNKDLVEIKNINNRLAGSISDNEKKELTAKKTKLTENITNNKLQLAATEQLMANVITEAITKNKLLDKSAMGNILSPVSNIGEIKNILVRNGYNSVDYKPSDKANPFGVIRELQAIADAQYVTSESAAAGGAGATKTVTTTLTTPQIAARLNADKGNITKAIKDKYPGLLNAYTAATFNADQNTLVKSLEANPQVLEAIKSVMPSAKTTSTIATNKREKDSDYATEMLGQILKQYQVNLTVDNPQVVTPLEISMNESLAKLTSDISKQFANELKNNTTGATSLRRANGLTALSLNNNPGDNDFSLGAYNTDIPHLVGKDPNGNWIVRYNIKEEFAGNKATVKGAVANFLSTGYGANKETAPKGSTLVTDSQIANWKKDNPDNLYVVVSGLNLDPTQKAADNYTKIVGNSIKAQTPEGQQAIRQTLNNFAPLWLISDSERRKVYANAASEIQDGIKQNEYKSFVQPPAVWKDNGDGTRNGFAINYVVENQQVSAKVFSLTIDNTGNIVNQNIITTKNLADENTNLPTALLSLDLMYGTGRPEDLVKAKSGFQDIDFVPAFYNLDAGNNLTEKKQSFIPVGATIR